MKSLGRPILSVIRGGAYASHAAAAKHPKEEHHAPKYAATPQDIKLTRLPNGVSVVSLENYSPVSHVAVLYNAGSRHESPDNLGITHCLRAASNLSAQKATSFAITKQLQQIGGNLECTTTREHVEYSINCLRKDLAVGVSMLNHAATAPAFKPWEIDRLSHRLKLDLDLYHRTPEAQLIELLHAAAYRDTLGQSLYMHPDNIGSYSPVALADFFHARYGSHGAVLAGVGVDHDQLVILARKMTFHSITPPAAPKKAKYHGGEQRVHHRGPLVHAALVTEGVPISSPDFLPVAILQLSLGVGPFVKYSPVGAGSKIGKAAATAAGSGPLAANSVNINYSDSGLFGFQVTAGAKDIRKVLTAVVGAMGQATKGSITDQDLQKAKKQLKALTHGYWESSEAILESIGQQVLGAGKTFPVDAADAAVDKVTADDVNKVAKKILNGKPTLAVVGDLAHTPYLDELVPNRTA
jgi:ubiquinol-cytochrome c reductase core subunit 2